MEVARDTPGAISPNVALSTHGENSARNPNTSFNGRTTINRPFTIGASSRVQTFTLATPSQTAVSFKSVSIDLVVIWNPVKSEFFIDQSSQASA
jgi:hypothetical protein